MVEKFQASRQLEACNETLGIGKLEADEQRTLAELMTEYLAKKQSPSLNLSETSIRHYQDSLSVFLKLANREYISQVTESDVLRYLDFLKVHCLTGAIAVTGRVPDCSARSVAEWETPDVGAIGA
jgi:hypothetical protein